jgi:hypothetical protein
MPECQSHSSRTKNTSSCTALHIQKIRDKLLKELNPKLYNKSALNGYKFTISLTAFVRGNINFMNNCSESLKTLVLSSSSFLIVLTTYYHTIDCYSYVIIFFQSVYRYVHVQFLNMNCNLDIIIYITHCTCLSDIYCNCNTITMPCHIRVVIKNRRNKI